MSKQKKIKNLSELKNLTENSVDLGLKTEQNSVPESVVHESVIHESVVPAAVNPEPVNPESVDLGKSNGSKISKLVSAAPISTEKVAKSIKKSFTDEDFKKYLTILNDGKPHKIQDLLKEFELPSTTAGREKLRSANRKIELTGKARVQPIFPNEIPGKHFQLISLEK